jgi:Orsellinic acid/F9775 biosynthesis cluster protein D
MRYEPQLRVMICRLCPEGVSKNGVALHYRRHHRDLPLRIRQELVEYANRFNDRCETENIQYPSTIIARIEDLEVHENGVRCLYDNCNEAFPLPSSMEIHCGEKHGWIKSKGSDI